LVEEHGAAAPAQARYSADLLLCRTLAAKTGEEAMTEPLETLEWKRSSTCNDGFCLEVAAHDDEIFVRNSKTPQQVARFTHEEWEAFRQGVANAEF
jgi:hypothetical protein